MKSDSIIIIPTYNEKENIENIIRAVFALEKYFHILIIEDNSPDGTADIVRRMQTEFPDGTYDLCGDVQGKLAIKDGKASICIPAMSAVWVLA